MKKLEIGDVFEVTDGSTYDFTAVIISEENLYYHFDILEDRSLYTKVRLAKFGKESLMAARVKFLYKSHWKLGKLLYGKT